MNQFEALCRLASDENWCWKLACNTCGHLHFRYAFSELAAGKSPTDLNWVIHRQNTRYSNHLGPLPRRYTEVQKEEIHKICTEADISIIASSCEFSSWLGYLGLVLVHMNSGSETYKVLSSSWALQLSNLVFPFPRSSIYRRLKDIAEGNGMLDIKDLESCEWMLIA